MVQWGIGVGCIVAETSRIGVKGGREGCYSYSSAMIWEQGNVLGER